MKQYLRPLALALFLFSFVPPGSRAQVGNDNPTGVTGEYNGSITTAGSIDPLTGNAKRTVNDLTVTGSVGAYPLEWKRTLNTRESFNTAGFGSAGAWTHNYHWNLWLRPYQPYHYYDTPYEGPDGIVNFPDGRTVELEVDEENNFTQKTGEPLVSIQPLGNGNYDVVLNDGGRVTFQVLSPPGSSVANFRAVAITDPHGIQTTFTHDASGRLSRITEQAGRYLQINYGTSYVYNGRTYYAGVIGSVQAFAREGQLVETVRYAYAAQPLAYDRRYWVLALTNAYYNEGTAEAAQATYTYYADDSMNGPMGGRIKTCQDVRYAGAMKNIAYEYMTGTPSKMLVAVGQVKREKNFTTGQTITEVRYPDNYPNPGYGDDEGWKRVQRRHEVRADGSAREFQYGGGELLEYTDFKNKRTYRSYGYVGGVYCWNVTDARGNTTHREGPAYAPKSIKRGNHPPVRFTYTDGGNAFWLASRTDERGHVTTHQRYPDSHRISRTDYPDGGVEEFTYNEFGQVLTHRMTSGGVANYRYDTRGRKTLSWPPATPSDPNPSEHPTQFIYYEWGPHTDRLERTIDPHGNSTWFYYNLRGQVTKVMHQDGSYTQSGYNPDGTLAWTADENHPNASWNESERTRYTYDEYKRVLTVTNPMGETTTNNYAIDINWVQPLLHTTNSIKYTLSPMGKNVVFDYDANYRKTSQVSALGTADEAWTLFEYDEVGNVTKTTDPRFNATTFTYDDRNRQLTVTDALNHTTTTTYDDANNKTSVARHGNPPLQFVEYDSMNRLTHKIDERGYHSYMDYDDAGNLVWQKDENENIYEYSYDELNRKKTMTYPPEGLNGEGPRRTEKWTYDRAGNLHTHTNRANVVQAYAPYDNRNRATWFEWSDGTPGQGFEYDAKSRLKRTYNAEANTTFHYDDADRKTSETQTVFSFGLNQTTTVGYQYDPDGNRHRTIYPAGPQFIYAYTHRNQLANIKLDPAIFGSGYESPAVAYAYDQSGNRVMRTLLKGASTPNAVPGASTQYAVDQVNRVYAQASYFANNQMGRFDYGFDALNRRIYEQRDFGLADGFQFDPTDQIIGYQREGTLDVGTGTVSSATASTLQFDGAGNRTQITGSFEENTYVQNKLNQYAQDAAGPAGYDEKGNLATYAGWTLTYDAQNRLTQLQHAGTNQLIIYRYDALNRRIAQKVNGVDTWYVYDNWNRIEERPTDGHQPRCYLFGGSVNEVVVSFGSGYPNYWYFQDGRGNTSHLADNEHVLLERYTYSFDGRVSYFDGNGISKTASLAENRFLFAGAILLPETMLYDMRNRIYYPRWGRFLQTDPIGFKGDSANLYRYCHNDAVNRSDPEGLVDRSSSDTWRNLVDFYSGNPSMDVIQDAWNQQRSMASVAEKNEGSTKYRNTKNWRGKDVFHCNEFVADMAEESGRERPQVWIPPGYGKADMGRWRDAVSNELADPNVKIPRWSEPKPLSEARRNDIIAQRHGKWGHSGIVTGPRNSISVNTGRGGVVEKGNWGFRPFPDNGEKDGDPPPVVRQYIPGSSGDW